MKKLLLLLIIAGSAVIFSSCGSSKTTTNKNVKVEQNEVEVLALEAHEKWAYGTASSYKLQFAKDQAAVYARMELSRIVAAGVKAGSKVYDQQYENQTAIENKGKVEQLGMVIAENELKNSRIVCSHVYEIPDRNLYEAHVCVEMPGNIADKIAEKYPKTKNFVSILTKLVSRRSLKPSWLNTKKKINKKYGYDESYHGPENSMAICRFYCYACLFVGSKELRSAKTQVADAETSWG